MKDVIPELVRTIRQVPAENYDDLVGDDDSLAGKEAVLREYDRPEKKKRK